MTTLPTINNFSPIVSNQKIDFKNQQFIYAPQGVDAVQLSTSMEPKIEKPTKMLFSLLKSGAFDKEVDKELFAEATDHDWLKMFNLAQNNGITGIVYSGIEKNSDIKVPEELQPYFEQTLKQIKMNHEMQERCLGEFSRFTESHGYDTINMKGIGQSMNYPDPQKRWGGDIDIFHIKHGTTAEESMKQSSFEVDKLAAKILPDTLVDTDHGVKHSVISYKGMPIENHRTFLNVENGIPMFKKMNNYLLRNINPVEKVLPNGTKIKVPSKEFNTVFLSFHAMQHFAGGNVAFKHLLDWAVHINKNGLQVPEEAKGTKFENFMYAFTNLANKHLGTNIKVPENKKLESEILNQMLGKSTETAKLPSTKNPIKVIFYKYQRMKSSVARKNDLFGEGATSMKKALLDSLTYRLKHPSKILSTFKLIK